MGQQLGAYLLGTAFFPRDVGGEPGDEGFLVGDVQIRKSLTLQISLRWVLAVRPVRSYVTIGTRPRPLGGTKWVHDPATEWVGTGCWLLDDGLSFQAWLLLQSVGGY
ncbi:hypothetical protein [Streptomyces chartreusis]|uniref:Uncharacterized protein n=1 Tax=Streptomyces chartreusis TaxID=1969 RepID=A0A7H8TCJ1_STRCX|nr:hypothetical protein [Streptomyces chartreusis]QKZ21084.1 hypothetical protein HUT05_29345 [Streptomyces chartreusis]